MREVTSKSSADVNRMAPMPVVLKSVPTTSSSIFICRFGIVNGTPVLPELSPLPTGRKVAVTEMSLSNEGLRTRTSVRKLPTVPAMVTHSSFANAELAKVRRQRRARQWTRMEESYAIDYASGLATVEAGGLDGTI